jgi:hypothetical protein
VRAQRLGVPSREAVKCREPRHGGNRWKNYKVGSMGLTGGHASPRKRSQHSVDFSCLRDSQSKSTETQPFKSRSRK